jgi:hypothetical protein
VVAQPTISNVSFPTTGIVGIPFSYGATVSDRWTTTTSLWNFGDGTTGALSGTKAYGTPGVFGPTLTATDPFGNAATAHASITITAPTVGGAGMGGAGAGAGGARGPGAGLPSVTLPGTVEISPKTGTGTASFACHAPAGDVCVISGRVQSSAKGSAAKRKPKSRKPTLLGTFSGTIPGGKSGTVTFKLSKTGRTQLKHTHPLKAQAVGVSHNRAGQSVKINKHITLKLKKK